MTEIKEKAMGFAIAAGVYGDEEELIELATMIELFLKDEYYDQES